jgi:membrane-associated phospholipid phosphatase
VTATQDRARVDLAEPQPLPQPQRAAPPGPRPRRREATAPRPHPVLRVLGVAVGCYVLLAAVMIGTGAAFTHFLGHGPVGRWDDHVNAWFAARRSATWNDVSGAFSSVADTLGIVVMAAVATFVLLLRRWATFGLFLIIGLAFELATFLSTTYLVARPRPSVAHLGGTPSTFSWPSGHTAATLVLYGGIALLVMAATPRRLPRVSAWAVAVILTTCVAVSRIYRGEHHPTDTVAGVALGVGALWATVTVLRAGHVRRPHPTESEAIERTAR